MIDQKISHYEIVAKIGEGGMGVVYRARDVNLHRSVAVKFISPERATDPAAVRRFQREARAAGTLNHPSICTVHDFGIHDGSPYVVMELLEGDSLQALLAAGPIPTRKAVNWATDLARGLAAAAADGIVHRDLKPSNLFITGDGRLKILDFGLAKLIRPNVTIAADAESAGLTMTAPGAVVGTPGYMSPEQTRGEALDHRSDLFALGAILYEMIAGRRAFPGDTYHAIGYAIQACDPAPLSGESRNVPLAIEAIIFRLLEKNPDERFQSAQDVAYALEALSGMEGAGGAAMGSGTGDGPTPTRWRLVPWLLLPLAALVAWFVKPSGSPAPSPTRRLEITLSEGQRLSSFRNTVAITADGGMIAYVAGRVGGPWGPFDSSRIYLRALDQPRARPVPGADNGTQPFFSPDGRWLGFVRNRHPMRVPVAGGEPETIGDVDASFGACWAHDGSIVYAGTATGLFRIVAAGGEPDTLTWLDRESGEISHRLPHALPDRRVVLYTAVSNTESRVKLADMRVYAQTLDSQERVLIAEKAADARYLPTGHIVFAREGSLVAVRFDPDRLEVSGPEVTVLEGVRQSVNTGWTRRETLAAHFDVAASGELVFVRGSIFPEIPTTVVWVDRQGHTEPVGVEPREYQSVRLSPDGSRILLTTAYPPRDVWTWDLERGLQRRQTFEGNQMWAIWGPGPDQFTMDSDRAGPNLLYLKTIDTGPGLVERLPTGDAGTFFPSSWSPDNSELAYISFSSGGSGSKIWLAAPDGATKPLLDSVYLEHYPEFSPDGRWLAYSSSESGRTEVYVRPYRGPGPAVQISTDGGRSPAWSRDGQEIVFAGGSPAALYSSHLEFEGDQLKPGRTERLFGLEHYRITSPIRSFDIAADGRILLVREPEPANRDEAVERIFPDRIDVVLNWFVELEARVPE